jgi:hypothetical protein
VVAPSGNRCLPSTPPNTSQALRAAALSLPLRRHEAWPPGRVAHVVLKQTTYETSQTGDPARRICQVVASQKFVSEEVAQYCDIALVRHTFPDGCPTENRSRLIFRRISGPVPTSAVALPECLRRPVHRNGMSMRGPQQCVSVPASRSSSRGNRDQPHCSGTRREDKKLVRWLSVVKPASSVRAAPAGSDYFPDCVKSYPACQPAAAQGRHVKSGSAPAATRAAVKLRKISAVRPSARP